MGTTSENPYVRRFETLKYDDVPVVGGKNASLGEMIRSLKEKGVAVPTGFAITSFAYCSFLEANNLTDKIKSHLQDLESGSSSLEQVGKSIRRLFRNAKFPEEIVTAIRDAYHELGQRYDTNEVDVAVRSSATAEDLPEASFAGRAVNVSQRHRLRRTAGSLPQLLRFPVHRSRHQLP